MRESFYGWYMKCQSDTQTLAVIPAVHLSREKAACSIQIISDKHIETVTFAVEEFGKDKENLSIGKNRFGPRGMVLSMQTAEVCVEGKLKFGMLSTLKYNIMGPFSIVPFMECRHNVWSMYHLVCGSVKVNGDSYDFKKALGYWEGDSGRSFPKKYAWTQCFFANGSLMLSVAEIPIMRCSFTGIIGVVLWQGREFRFATYLGAKVVENTQGRIRIIQGKMELEVRILEFSGQPLMAPDRGKMVRTIQESVSCRAFYRFRVDEKTIFAFETERASFEYEYP